MFLLGRSEKGGVCKKTLQNFFIDFLTLTTLTTLTTYTDANQFTGLGFS